MISLHPLTGIAEIAVGDDLGAIFTRVLERASLSPRVNDVLVVTQKIVSKAEGRFVRLVTLPPSAAAVELAAATRKDARLVELVLRESSAVVRAAPNVLIVRTRHGLVMANAGIDRSNVGPGREDCALLLPLDPDDSARALAANLRRHLTRRAPSVLIADSFGRPWRQRGGQCRHRRAWGFRLWRTGAARPTATGAGLRSRRLRWRIWWRRPLEWRWARARRACRRHWCEAS